MIRLLAIAALLGAACGGAPDPPRGADCPARVRAALKARDRLLAHGVRVARRADLEALDRQLRDVVEDCRTSPGADPARQARAELRDAIARATSAPDDVKAALLAWAALAHPEAPPDAAALGLHRRADLALAFDQRLEGFALLDRLARKHPNTAQGRAAKRALALLAPLRPAPAPRERSRPGARPRPRPTTGFQGRAVDPDRLGIRFRTVAGRPAKLVQVRRWSTPAFSRVVAYFSQPVRYLHGVLPADGARPARLYLDFPATALGPRVKRARVVQGHLVRGIRLANRPPAGARLVTDLAGPLRYEIYPLRHPYRVVVDLWRARPAARPAGPETIRVVALDPGHGGAENGAVGPTGLKEKDVTLEVARHAAEVLKARGLTPVLTRTGDQAVTLEERSAIALSTGADLFVSIHANADSKGKQTGIETYYLDVESDQYAARLAARENRAAGHAVSRYRMILADLTTRALTTRSLRLAELVQKRLLVAARRQRPKLPDRGVRKAIFYVLLTARVPGILTEISFVSHKDGEASLRTPAYRKSLGQAIARGVLDYARTRAKKAPRRP